MISYTSPGSPGLNVYIKQYEVRAIEKRGYKMERAVMFLADGFEEIEGLAVVDILRRANVTIDTVSIMGSKEINGAHDIVIMADYLPEEVEFDSYDMVILPGGGMGHKNLGKSQVVIDVVNKFNSDDKYIAAICAAPTILGGMGLLKGKDACCYGGMEDGLVGANVKYDDVVFDGKLITSRGMGTAVKFALALMSIFKGEAAAKDMAAAIMLKEYY